MKISLIKHGILNVFMHVPVLFATSFWALLLMAIFGIEFVQSPFGVAISIFPIFTPPVSCLIGIFRGVKNWKKDKNASACLILSVLGLFIYVVTMAFCYWLGSIA